MVERYREGEPVTPLDIIAGAFVWGVATFSGLAGFAIPLLAIGALQQAWTRRH